MCTDIITTVYIQFYMQLSFIVAFILLSICLVVCVCMTVLINLSYITVHIAWLKFIINITCTCTIFVQCREHACMHVHACILRPFVYNFIICAYTIHCIILGKLLYTLGSLK